MTLRSFWSKPQLKYGLSLALLLFYGGILALASQPRVSAEYRAYYIDQTSHCYHNRPAAPISPSGHIRFGSKRPHQTCTTLREGWDWQQTWGTWSVANSSRLTFRAQSDAHRVADLLFHVIGFSPLGTQKAWVFINGEFADQWDLPHEQQTSFQLQIPLSENDEIFELTFYYSNPHALAWFDKATNPTDTRLLSMGLLGFQWIERQPENETR